MTSWKSIELIAGEETSSTVYLIDTITGQVLGPESQRARAKAIAEHAGIDSLGARWLDAPGDGTFPRLLLLPAKGSTDAERGLSAGGYLIDAMRAVRLDCLAVPSSRDVGSQDLLRGLLTGALLHAFRLDQRRARPSRDFVPHRLVVDRADVMIAEKAQQEADPINRARAWIEQPANVLTPAVFADEAAEALSRRGVTVRVLAPDELERIGAEALLAVARASEHEARMLVAEWRGSQSRSTWDAAIVGKGITFDGGGLNLKTRPIIDKMKFDMSGAAAVLGTMELVASREAAINVVAVVPMAENVIGSRGFRPGDVIGSLDGLTVEVVNTDAEGRLILADGIAYAIQNYAPGCIVDVATLTGSIAGVLHEEFAGLYANDDELAASLIQAGADVFEPVWRLPLSSSQDYLVESTIADVANFGTPGFLGFGGGSPTAGAKFLERFAKGARWAHLDIAGPAWTSRRTIRSGKGATGFGTALLGKWLAGLEERFEESVDNAANVKIGTHQLTES